jgi:hypothetical protein
MQEKMNTLSLFVNEQLAFECDRSMLLDEKQLEFLDRMDSDMERGFKIQGELITHPDKKQKATFVTMNLLNALRQEDNAKIAVACAYLSNRLPHVVEVHARDAGDRIDIEFVEEH